MSLELSLEELLELLEGRLAVGMMGDQVGPVKTDTRSEIKDCWFLALCGEKFDGHDFIGEAYSSGALGCVVNERTGYPIAETSFPLIAVEDTLLSYGRLARNWRKRLGFKVVCVLSEDRDQSSKVYEKLVKRQASSEEGRGLFIDTRLMRIEHCFEKILDATPDNKFLLANLVPQNCYEAELLIKNLSPDIVCVIGSPFSYLRLFDAKKQISAVCDYLYSDLAKQNGSLIWNSYDPVPPVIAAEQSCSVYAIPAKEAETDGEINMIPRDQYIRLESDWCVDKVVTLLER